MIYGPYYAPYCAGLPVITDYYCRVPDDGSERFTNQRFIDYCVVDYRQGWMSALAKHGMHG